MKRILLVLPLLFLMACSPKTKTFDGSSEEKFRASYEVIIEDMSEQETRKLDFAMAKLLSDLIKERKNEDLEQKDVQRIIYSQIDGKTAEEVIELAYGK